MSVPHLTTADYVQKVGDYKNVDKWSFKGERPCLVDFYTTWCVYCKNLNPILDDLKKEFAGKHDVSALLGGEIRQDKNRSASSERYGYDDMRLTYSMVDWATLSKDGVEGGLYSALRRRSEVLNVYEEMHRYVSAYFNG